MDLKKTTTKILGIKSIFRGSTAWQKHPLLQAKAKKVRNKYSYVGTQPFSS
jgi:hypothetical protein